MKLSYTLLTCSLLVIASITQAQIKKGSILLGGSIQYSNETGQEIPDRTGKEKVKAITIGPAIGYALADNLVLGLELGYSHGKSNMNFRDHKSSGYSGVVFMRKYWNITSKFYAFANAEAGYGRGTAKTTDKGNANFRATNKSWAVNATVKPGIAFSVNKKIMLESTFFPLLNVEYGKSNFEYTDVNFRNHSTVQQFKANSSFTNGQTFSLGVRFLL